MLHAGPDATAGPSGRCQGLNCTHLTSFVFQGRCQHCQLQEGFEEGDEVEGFRPGSESCTNPATIKSSVSSGGARGNSSQCPMAAGRAQRVADRVEKDNLERAILRAQTQAVVPPVSAQIISRKGFIEREKKRLAVAEEAVIAAVQNRDECLKALAQGERRLEELHLQEMSPVAPVPDAEAELARLRAQVGELQGSTRVVERHTKKTVCPAQAMPGLIPAEL